MSPDRSALFAGLSRRRFLYCSALATGGAVLGGCATERPRRLTPAEKLNLGVIGASGKGAGDTDCCAGENIIALCDVDEKAARSRRGKYPHARFYRDFRMMLERERSLDAVIIATPDHTHAVAAAAAMRMGKHVYCQKPLTQTIYEARLLRYLAKKHKVVTQMGNQSSAEDGLRRAVEVIQGGLLGSVRQVYTWTNRPIWPQGMNRPSGEDPVPDTLDWDAWIGPAPMRPYKAEWPGRRAGNRRRTRGAVYHPFDWRGWQDFGTGALGAMACDTANLPFRALKLGLPNEIEPTLSPTNTESYPLKSTIRFGFPARGGQAPVSLWWYAGGDPLPDRPFDHDASNKPPEEVLRDVKALMDRVPGSGCLLIGDRGKLFSPGDYGTRFFVKLKDEKELTDGMSHEAVRAVPQAIVRNVFEGSADLRQHLEWIAACKGGPPCYSEFDVAAPLTEMLLLGCVALRVGRRIEWDAANMAAPNAPEAADFIRRRNRKGWEL